MSYAECGQCLPSRIGYRLTQVNSPLPGNNDIPSDVGTFASMEDFEERPLLAMVWVWKEKKWDEETFYIQWQCLFTFTNICIYYQSKLTAN
jgi:hypothetical protein